jgi:hypothetical protein
MSVNLLDEAEKTPGVKTNPELPEKFRDPADGSVRLDQLIKSYLDLERRLSRKIDLPTGPDDREAHARLRKALGVPDAPDGYRCKINDPDLRQDPEIDQRLHAAGFTPEQAQLVYDLAAEYVLPAIRDMGANADHKGHYEKLVGHFGGEDAYREVSRQLKAWGTKHLPPEVYGALGQSHQGVLALLAMMKSGEPGVLRGAAAPAAEGEEELDRKMRDPRYWRDRDPQFVAQVTEGFKRLYRS